MTVSTVLLKCIGVITSGLQNNFKVLYVTKDNEYLDSGTEYNMERAFVI